MRRREYPGKPVHVAPVATSRRHQWLKHLRQLRQARPRNELVGLGPEAPGQRVRRRRCQRGRRPRLLTTLGSGLAHRTFWFGLGEGPNQVDWHQWARGAPMAGRTLEPGSQRVHRSRGWTCSLGPAARCQPVCFARSLPVRPARPRGAPTGTAHPVSRPKSATENSSSGAPRTDAKISPCCWDRRIGSNDGVAFLVPSVSIAWILLLSMRRCRRMPFAGSRTGGTVHSPAVE